MCSGEGGDVKAARYPHGRVDGTWHEAIWRMLEPVLAGRLDPLRV
jgi:hypothetical protein